MLKKTWKLFLGLVVCASSACVTPTHASSAIEQTVIITKIQAASPISAKDELIELYNTTTNDIDLSGWCVTNKALVKFACFDVRQKDTTTSRPLLPAGAYATLISDDFLVHNLALSSHDGALTFTPTSQSSGSLVASSDILTLVDADDEIWDTLSWQAAISSGKLLARQVATTQPLTYKVTGSTADWQSVAQDGTVRSSLQWLEVVGGNGDSRNEEDDAQNNIPDSPDESVYPPLNQEVIMPLRITELLPNAVGSDTGNEFIEVYNPNLFPVSGDNYKLLVGANLDKSYLLSLNFTVAPLSYAVIKNDVVKYTLSNTVGAVQLSLKGARVGEPIAYTNPPEGESWAMINGVWKYTSNPTPGADNRISDDDEAIAGSAAKAAVVQKPCADNQFRNPTTGRCKLIATAASAQVPCKANQTRNPDTGRCRNNASAATSAPCKPGQERHAETNRCRNITKMSKVGSQLKPIEKTQGMMGMSWYMWLGIGAVVIAVLSYAIWEWREEVGHLFKKIKARLHLIIK